MKTNIDQSDLITFWDHLCIFGHEKDWLDDNITYYDEDTNTIVWKLDNWNWLKKNGLHPDDNSNFRIFFEEIHLYIYSIISKKGLFSEDRPWFKVDYFYTNIVGLEVIGKFSIL